MIKSVYIIYGLLSPNKRRSSIALFVLIFIGTILEVLGIGMVLPVIAILIDENLTETYPGFKFFFDFVGVSDFESQIQIIMFLLVFIYMVKNIYLAFLAWWQAKFSFSLQIELSQRLFTIYLMQPYIFHLQRNSSQMFRNITSEVNEFVGKGVNPIISVVAEIIILLSIILLLVIVEPIGTIVVALILFVASWGFHRLTRDRISIWGKRRLHHDGLRVQHLNQGLAGVKDIKLFGRESEFLDVFYKHTSKSFKVMQYIVVLQKLPRLWLELLAVLGIVILTLIMLGKQGGVSNVIPVIGLFAVAAFRLMPSVSRIINDVQSFRYALPTINHLHDEFNLQENKSIGILPVNTRPVTFRKYICLSDVSFKYPGENKCSLISIDLKIKYGECVGIIGPSGSGKSTVIDVILGLLEPSHGGVIVDGYDIRENMRSWQDQIGYVPQSIYLTDDSLRRNIALGVADSQIDDFAIQRAIELSQLSSFIYELPDGIETTVGERGVRLSGGQLQRIGIARALYNDPDVLVLDEATSALDRLTEAEVMKAIMLLQGKKTIIIIAHRHSTIAQCDRIYQFENGMIRAEGNPDEILG